MFHSTLIENPILKLISERIGESSMILDVAEGSGVWGFHIKTIVKGNPLMVGIDIWYPYIKRLKQFNVYDALILCDARYPPFRERCFHIILACEILEHIEKVEMDDFLLQLERLYKKRLIVSTPDGFQCSIPRDDNPFQEHISGISSKELIDKGFNILIVNKKEPRSIKLFIKIRAFILRRKINKALIGWKDKK